MRQFPGIVLILLLTAATGAAEFGVRPVFGAEQPALRQVVITVKGMMCASCGREIEKTLKAAPGVTAVVVDVPKDQATVTYDERKITPLRLAEMIRKAGYEALLPAEMRPAPPAGR